MFRHFHPGMADVFGIFLSKTGGGNTIVEFGNTLYIQGPVSWDNVALECKRIDYEGRPSFEISDSISGFKVVAGTAIRAVDAEFYVSVQS